MLQCIASIYLKKKIFCANQKFFIRKRRQETTIANWLRIKLKSWIKFMFTSLCMSWRVFRSSRYCTLLWSLLFVSLSSLSCSINLQRLSRWSKPTFVLLLVEEGAFVLLMTESVDLWWCSKLSFGGKDITNSIKAFSDFNASSIGGLQKINSKRKR